jgi:hypothetical protein
MTASGPYFFAFRFFAVFRFLVVFLAAFFGTFLPLARASESPIAMACLRLFTVLPERPLFKVPALRFFIARSTSAEAFLEYFRAMDDLPVVGKIIVALHESSSANNPQVIAS